MDKKLISYIFIHRVKKRETSAIISLLTSNYEYYQFEAHFNVLDFKPRTFSKLDLLFKPFRFDNNTSIGILNIYNKNDAIYHWLHIISTNVGCNLKLVKLNDIAKRIYSFHKSYIKGNRKASEIGSNYFNKLWQKILKNERCPWINPEINNQIELMSYGLKRKELTTRLGLYYLLVKKFMYAEVKKSTLKRQNNL